MTHVKHDHADTATGTLKLAEFMAEMNVAERTARRWLTKGRVPGAWKTPGGHWRVPVATVEQLKRAA